MLTSLVVAIALAAPLPPIPLPPMPVGDFDWGRQFVEQAQSAQQRLKTAGFHFNGDRLACLWAHLGLATVRGLATYVGHNAQRQSRESAMLARPAPGRPTYSADVQKALNRARRHFEDFRDQKCGGKPPRANKQGIPPAVLSADPEVQKALQWLHDHAAKPSGTDVRIATGPTPPTEGVWVRPNATEIRITSTTTSAVAALLPVTAAMLFPAAQTAGLVVVVDGVPQPSADTLY
jgi:hypothetical protein